MTDEQVLNTLQAASFNLNLVINQIESLANDNPVKDLTEQLKTISAQLTTTKDALNG